MKNWLYKATVLITGASSGIGRALTKVLIEKYSCNIIGIARNEEKLKLLQEEVKKEYNSNFEYLVFDVSKKDSWEKIFESVKDKKVSLIINNAGTMLPFLKGKDLDEKEVERLFKINFYSLFYCFKTFNTYFEKQGKNSGIVNITSSSSLCSVPGQSVYSASKSAATKFSLIISSEEHKKYFIGTYLPGFTNTNLFNSLDNKKAVFEDEKSKKVLKLISMKPEKLAKKIVKSISKKKRYKKFGADSFLLNFLNCFSKAKTSDFLLKIFEKSKLKCFEDLFEE